MLVNQIITKNGQYPKSHGKGGGYKMNVYTGERRRWMSAV